MEKLISVLKWVSYGLGLLSVCLVLVWVGTFVSSLTTSPLFNSIYTVVTKPLTWWLPALFENNPQGALFLFAMSASTVGFTFNRLLSQLEWWVVSTHRGSDKKRRYADELNIIQRLKAVWARLGKRQYALFSRETLSRVFSHNKGEVYFVLVFFPFNTNRSKGEIFFEYHCFEGKELSCSSNALLVVFPSVKQALNYAKHTQNRLKRTYDQMKSTEIKPVFKLGIHTEAQGGVGMANLDRLLHFCQALCNIASASEIVSSKPVVLSLINKNNNTIPCTITPLGLYRLENSLMQEVFELQ
jgi:hypothetical protein